jgi:hypothetical protein
VLLDWE